MTAIVAVQLFRIMFDSFVKVTLAGDVIVNAKNVRWTRLRREEFDVGWTNTDPAQIAPDRMTGVYLSS